MRGFRTHSCGNVYVRDHVANELIERSPISAENSREYITIEDKSTGCNWLVLKKTDIVEVIEDWLRLAYQVRSRPDIRYLYTYAGITGLAATAHDQQGTYNLLDEIWLTRPGGVPCIGASRMAHDTTILIQMLGWDQFVQVCLDIHHFLQPASAGTDERWVKWEDRFRTLSKEVQNK